MKSKNLNGTEYLKMFILLSNVLLLLVQRFVSGKQMLCIEGFFFTLLHYNYWCHVCFCKCEFNHLFKKAFFQILDLLIFLRCIPYVYFIYRCVRLKIS